MAALRHLAERSQELQRQLHIGSRAPGQQDPRFDQVRRVVPGPGLVRHRRRKIVRPPGGAFQFPAHEPKPGAQGARFVPFVSHLIQVELAEELHHLPGFGLLARYLVDQRQALHAIAHRSDIGRVSKIEELDEALPGGGQFVALVMRQANILVPPAVKQA